MKGVLTLGLFALIASSLPRHGRSFEGIASESPQLPDERERAPAIGSTVESAAKAFMENQQTVGLSIGILKDGKAYTYNFGTTERGKQHPPSARTLYAIASITKTFTGTLLARAVVEKRVKLDDGVRRYLDGDYPNLEYQGQPVRLWQLINHTSGLPRSLPENVDSLIGQDEDAARRSLKEAVFLEGYTREDFFRDLHRVRLTRVPGEKFSYSGAAAELLGLVLERVYGKSYEELVRIKITRPLKMNDTKVTLTAGDRARAPMGYGAGGAFIPALSTRFPAAGSLWSTSADMLKYIAWNLAERDEAVKLAHQPAGNTIWSQDNSYTVGLDWQVMRSPGRRIIVQDGTAPGFTSLCAMCPELNLGIIVLTNEEVRSMPVSLSPMINQILRAVDPRAAATP
jgi:serine-type D-Ala-D-Ala carboxypeptidase/endopeptidase